MYIEELIKGLNLEDYRIEFKGIIKEGKAEDGERLELSWLRAIASFANTDGGSLFVGVEDKTHKIISLDHLTFDKIALMVQRLLLEHMEPKIDYCIIHHDIVSEKQTRYVMEIQVKKSIRLPVVLHYNGMGLIYVRRFGQYGIATSEEIRSLVLQSSDVAFDSEWTLEVFNRAKFNTLFDCYKEKNGGRELTEKALISIGFMDENHRLCKGALLFEDDYDGLLTLTEMIEFRSHSKGNNKFFAVERIHENIISSIKKACAFVSSHSVNGYEKLNDGRKDLISYPPRAVEEAIVNAFAHRNYFIEGSQIEVNVFTDRLEIVSPGAYVGGRLIQQERRIDLLPPQRRNEVICAVLHLCHLMERQGSGFDNIRDDYLPYGEAYAPYVDAFESSFAITLPDLTYEGGPVLQQEFVRLAPIPTLEDKYSLKVLGYCYNKPRTTKEIADYLGISVSSYLKNSILEKLVEKEFLVCLPGYPSKFRTNFKNVTLL